MTLVTDSGDECTGNEYTRRFPKESRFPSDCRETLKAHSTEATLGALSNQKCTNIDATIITSIAITWFKY
jgi:hypothetical protein